LGSAEKYSEGKIDKSEAETRDGNVNTVYYGESVAQSLFARNEQAVAVAYICAFLLEKIPF